MDEKQRGLLRDVIYTLNSITVSGADNLDKLLGCIRALQDVLRAPAADKEQESDSDV